MLHLKNKTIFITGASSGIGAAMAKAYSKEGARVVLTARRVELLHALLREIETEGGEGLVCACDVTQEGDLAAAVQAAVKKFGSLDVVVANAGFPVIGPMVKLSLEDYRRQFETNVFGVLRTIYATIEELKKSRGSLVLIGSVSGYVPSPFFSPYSMSKFALRSLADSLYAELALYGISVLLVTAGFVQSGIYNVGNDGEPLEGGWNPLPTWLPISTERCAKKIVKATCKKKREQIITLHGRILLFVKKYFGRFLQRSFKHIVLKSGYPKIRIKEDKA